VIEYTEVHLAVGESLSDNGMAINGSFAKSLGLLTTTVILFNYDRGNRVGVDQIINSYP
jgi:hypothetical protein